MREWIIHIFTDRMPDGILMIILVLTLAVAGLCISILWADYKDRRRRK